MIEKIKAILTEMLTGKDNVTHDIGHWSWFISVATILCMLVYHEWKGIAVTFTEVWQALAGISVAHGVAAGAKAKTTPDPQ